MIPELRGRWFLARLFPITGESLQAENQPAHRFDADELHRFGDADNFVANAKFGGVDDLQKFRGDGNVLFDDFRDVLHRCDGRLENFFDLQESFGGSRQSANAADDATNFVIGDDFAEARQPNEQLCERGVIARFAEISMTDEKAARNFKAIRVTGNDDARAVGLVLDNVAKEAKPVHVRHGQVGYNSVELT